MAKTKVLLVEDVQIAQKVAVIILKQFSCDVDVANNGQEALALLANNQYDTMFLDLGLPDVDGLTLAQTIRETNTSMPIVALTAHQDETYKHMSQECGVNEFLVKPFTESDCKYVLDKVAPQVEPPSRL